MRSSGRARTAVQSGERPEDVATRDFDAEGRPLMRQEDEAPGTGAPGVDVGRPAAMPPEQEAALREERDDDEPA